MGNKAEELAALLKGRKWRYVNIEQPDHKGSTVETVIEDRKGVEYSVEGDKITFKGNGKTAAFTLQENAQIITNQADESGVIATFAGNGGLQIKGTVDQ